MCCLLDSSHVSLAHGRDNRGVFLPFFFLLILTLSSTSLSSIVKWPLSIISRVASLVSFSWNLRPISLNLSSASSCVISPLATIDVISSGLSVLVSVCLLPPWLWLLWLFFSYLVLFVALSRSSGSSRTSSSGLSVFSSSMYHVVFVVCEVSILSGWLWLGSWPLFLVPFHSVFLRNDWTR